MNSTSSSRCSTPCRPPRLPGSCPASPAPSSLLVTPRRPSSQLSPHDQFRFVEEIGAGSFGAVYLAIERAERPPIGTPRRQLSSSLSLLLALARQDSSGSCGSATGDDEEGGAFPMPMLLSSSSSFSSSSRPSTPHTRPLRPARKVAIKVINLEAQEDGMEEIQREIDVLSHCHCPQLTRYFGSYVVEHSLWIVMEYLEGGSLGELLTYTPHGRLDEIAITSAMSQLCQALAYLHGERKIHRDVKAKNVLVSCTGQVKLADFGVTASLTETMGKRQTFAGTPFWMAPEVITQTSYDFKADVWSLGITAMELANGAPPYAKVHPVRALFLIPKNPPPRLEEEKEEEGEGEEEREDGGEKWSEGFKEFVGACLRKDPMERLTAGELLLLPFLKDEGRVEEGRKRLVDLVRRRVPSQRLEQEEMLLAEEEEEEAKEGERGGEGDMEGEEEEGAQWGGEEEVREKAGSRRSIARRVMMLALERQDTEDRSSSCSSSSRSYNSSSSISSLRVVRSASSSPRAARPGQGQGVGQQQRRNLKVLASTRAALERSARSPSSSSSSTSSLAASPTGGRRRRSHLRRESSGCSSPSSPSSSNSNSNNNNNINRSLDRDAMTPPMGQRRPLNWGEEGGRISRGGGGGGGELDSSSLNPTPPPGEGGGGGGGREGGRPSRHVRSPYASPVKRQVSALSSSVGSEGGDSRRGSPWEEVEVRKGWREDEEEGHINNEEEGGGAEEREEEEEEEEEEELQWDFTVKSVEELLAVAGAM